MNAKELKKAYLEFFKKKGHTIIPGSSLIPEHDPTVLFTTAGMHPLVPYLLGQTHPAGKRLANVQRCIRTQDIDEVGDATHTTFFEMLGNWSLGDYFKKEAIMWSLEFLTSTLKLPLQRLAVTCFAGDADAPKDQEAALVWKSLGMPEQRLSFLPKKDNWWGPAGTTGPCGPDTEIFYWVSDSPPPTVFNPKNKNWVEIWNDVFLQYNKTDAGKFVPLQQKNVDTGLGVERVTMILQGKNTVFDSELFQPIFAKISELTDTKPSEKNIRSYRIIADHMRAATFVLGDERGIGPSNVDQGYVVRRFIRRVIRHTKLLGSAKDFTSEIAKVIIKMYSSDYPLLEQKKTFILSELKKEEDKFEQTLEHGLKEFQKIANNTKILDSNQAFLLFQSYGFPLEMIKELATEQGIQVDEKGFAAEFNKHQELSRVGAEKKFKGGLSESSDVTKKLHTATHLLNEALRQVVSKDITQRGSNITPERLRFDFNCDRKLTPEEIKKVENLVNEKIAQTLPITRTEMSLDDARKKGAQAEFGAKYSERVSVYAIGNFSLEVCGGPHVENTKELGHFKIIKEESSAAGIRRIKAVVD